MAIVLESLRCRADVLPHAGGRVQHLVDQGTGRELLYVRRHPAERGGFLETTTGGWDLLFPNDEAWRGHPDHGRVWNAPFDVIAVGGTACTLSVDLEEPPVTLTRSLSLLDAPRCGLREEIRIEARADIGPFLAASHPALAVAEGWRVELPGGARGREADADYPGRFRPGQALDRTDWARAAQVPGPAPPVVEVLYVDGISSAEIVSADDRARTRVAWDAAALPCLWICTLTGVFPDADPALVLLEPATSRPYRLDDAIAAGLVATLRARETWTAWTEVESFDRPSAAQGAAPARDAARRSA